MSASFKTFDLYRDMRDCVSKNFTPYAEWKKELKNKLKCLLKPFPM